MPSYMPREKDPGINKKFIIIPILIVCILIGFFGVKTFNKKEEINSMFTVCSYDTESLQENIKTSFKDTYAISDYLYYGESINLYAKKYNSEKIDSISGRTVILRDICSDNEYAYIIGNDIDRGITFNNVKEGFYEIYVVEDLVEKRATYAETLDSSIHSVHRDGKSLNMNLIANKDLFNEAGITLEDNYLYLSVSEVETENDDDYDVVLDPSGMDYDFSYELNEGGSGNGIKENDAAFEACELLKKELESKGLKVYITRENKEEIVNSYGDDGRLERAYSSKAKYYIRINFVEESYYKYEGFDVTYSSHASNQFASQLVYTVDRKSKMNINGQASNGDGLFASYLLTGDDKRAVYDTDLWCREAGGKATNASKFSENASAGTGSFAKDNVYGMNTVNITLGYLNSSDDITYWKNNKEKYMQVLAEGICQYLNIEEEE